MSTELQPVCAPVDHLTALPSELIQNIASFLFATHELDKALYVPHERQHDLERLAGTCRALRHEVNTWAQHFLLQHKAITKYKPPRSTEKTNSKGDKKGARTAKNPQQDQSATFAANSLRHSARHSQGLLSWSSRKCVFCGKSSSRSAILMNGLKCCRECDTLHWPDKVTRTDARKEFDLKDHHLLPHRHQTGPLIGNIFKNLGIPRLRYGMYLCQGIPAMMFMRQDVARLAEMVHGDLKGHLEQRQAQREKLKATKEANAEKRKDAASARAAAEASKAQRNAARAAEERATMEELVVISDDEDFGPDREDEIIVLS
ncbi:hypothetical protein Slin14017_G063200 [Septoria linicola]|nr:hypothetical protein Slin14017_G063200 [Septoria linicola]